MELSQLTGKLKIYKMILRIYVVKYLAAKQSCGVFDPCGIRQMDMQAYPLGSLPAGIKTPRLFDTIIWGFCYILFDWFNLVVKVFLCAYNTADDWNDNNDSENRNSNTNDRSYK